MMKSVGLALAVVLAPSESAGTREASVIGAEIRLIEIDAFVTDKKGRAVADLTQDDFEVYEDGALMLVGNFQRDAGVELRAQPPGLAGAGTPSVQTKPEPAPLVVYVDNANLTPGRRAQVLDGVLRFLRREVEAGRYRVLVVAYDQGVRPLTPLTEDAGVIGAALEAVKRMPTQASGDEERSAMFLVRDILDAKRLGCEGGFQLMVDTVRRSAETTLHQVRTTVSRLGEVLGSLGAIPGRKALLYLSEGFQQRPGIHLFHQLYDLCESRGSLPGDLDRTLVQNAGQEYDVSPDLHEVTALANANRVTIYTVDASGLKGFSSASVEQNDRRFAPSALNDSIRMANLRHGQHILADETGGTAIFDSNEPDGALGRLAVDAAGHYALGYVPPHAPDRKTHRIDVRLKGSRRSLTLTHRRSYRDEDVGDRVAQRTLAALVFGIEQNFLDASLRPKDAKPAADGMFSVPLEVSIPVAKVESLRESGVPGILRVLIATRPAAGGAGPDGKTSIRQKVITLPSRQPSADPDARHTFVVTLDLGAGDHDIALGIRDEASALASYLRCHVHLAADRF